MPFLLRPLPDELFMSVIARFIVRRGIPGCTRRQLHDVLGFEISVAADLPIGLGVHSDFLMDICQLPTEKIALKHTTLGYWASGRSVETAAKALQAVVGDDRRCRSPYLTLGVGTSSIRPPSMMRVCRECYFAEAAEHGEPYWHVSHQLPTISFCPVHLESLFDTNIFRAVQKRGGKTVPAGTAKISSRVRAGPMTQLDRILGDVSLRALNAWPPKPKAPKPQSQLSLFEEREIRNLRRIEKWAVSSAGSECLERLGVPVRPWYPQNWLRLALRDRGPLPGAPSHLLIEALREMEAA